MLCNFIEIKLRHGCFRVNLLHIFRIAFTKNTSWWWLLLQFGRAIGRAGSIENFTVNYAGKKNFFFSQDSKETCS